MRKPKTHFEQVPLKDLRKIVGKDTALKMPSVPADLVVEPTTAKVPRVGGASRVRR